MTNNLGGTPPAKGYTDAVKRTEELDERLTEKAGRAVPDEKRFRSEEREDNVRSGSDGTAPRYTAGAEPQSSEDEGGER